jgi:site-specific recombinase XerD
MALIRSNEADKSTIEMLISDFIEYLEIEKTYSPYTIIQYKHFLTRFLDWLNENYKILYPQDINHEIVRKYRVFLAHFKDKDGKQLKRTTQGYHIIVLRAFLRYMITQRDIDTLSPEKIDLPKQGSRSVNFLNIEQIERLLNSPDISDEAGLRDRTILETLFSTGLRVSELVSLDRDKINVQRREVGVRGKGNKMRVVFISHEAAHWIERYVNYRKDNYKPLFIRYSGKKDDSKNGEKMRLTARSIQNIVTFYARKCGLPLDVTPHTLRHSFATDLLISGADLRAVQEMLGHESIRTTQVYTHVTDRHLKEVHETFHRHSR